MRKTIITSFIILLPLCASAQEVKDSAAVAFSDSVFQTLPEVMVSGNKPVVKVDGAKLVFDVGQLIKDKPVDNAYDALKYLPGVTPQGDDINLSGMPVSLMVNGKLTSMTREQIVSLLKSMPASRVQNAEVMYSAPARYQVRGALINVTLEKDASKEASLQGELYAKAEAQDEAHFNERASLAFHKGIVFVDGYYSMSHGKSYNSTDKTGVHTLNNGEKHDIDTRMAIWGDSRPVHDYRIAADIDFAKDHQLSVSYSGNYKEKNQHTEMSGLQTSSMDNHIKDILHNAHLDYTLPIGLNFGADFTYYENNIEQDLTSELLGNKLDFITTSQQRINRSKFFAREEHRLGKKAMVNYGMVYTHIIDHSRQEYVPTGKTTAEQLPSPLSSRRTENILNIYGGGSVKLSDKLSTEFSLAAEHSKTAIWKEWDFYPTLTTTYMPKSGRMWQLAFTADKKYPDFWAMQNVTSYYGGNYEQIVGNPALKPSKDFNLSLVHVLHNKYIFRGWFTHTKDYYTQTMFQARDKLVEIDKFD
ncbi:MAG: TonB-dependent receptor plug domain-containing protein, partial [Prevotella sp.]